MIFVIVLGLGHDTPAVVDGKDGGCCISGQGKLTCGRIVFAFDDSKVIQLIVSGLITKPGDDGV